jgi:hypothetical protein
MLANVKVCLAVFVIHALAGLVWAADVFVDQKNPAANEKNPGTEVTPFKTIQTAVDSARPGDTIWVKQGDYEEQVWIRNSGTMDRPITLSAWKDDRVRIGYPPRTLPVEGKWRPAQGSKSFQIKLTQDMPDDFLVLLDEKPIVTWMKDAPPPDDKVNQAAYRKSDRTLMFNANGKNPAMLGRFEYGRRPGSNVEYSFFHVDNTANWWVIRKMEFSWQNQGLRMFGNNCIVEKCFFYKCYGCGLGIHGRTDIVRRCNFYQCGSGIGASGNRSLADDVDNDGKGGWTDQGSEADMRAMATGRREFGGVSFNILPDPRSVVVLKSSNRTAGGLPEKVTIPVGKKFDTLFFLHAAAWVGGKEYFHYVLHYADGKDATISVGPANMADWVAEPVVRFPNETVTFTTVAQTVKVPQFNRGSVYRMEWSAPTDRRAVEIKSIEFVGNGSTVPVLLGITGVTEW